jgi:hypothetical protein
MNLNLYYSYILIFSVLGAFPTVRIDDLRFKKDPTITCRTNFDFVKNS